jgi:N,N-dimethylformamidase
MLRITGYSDKYQAFPGEKIKFYVNSEKKENYDVQIVRLIHGDTNPEGPGYKEEEIGAICKSKSSWGFLCNYSSR